MSQSCARFQVCDGLLSVVGNEEQVGKAIRDSGVPRDELYVTTKLGFVFFGIYSMNLDAECLIPSLLIFI